VASREGRMAPGAKCREKASRRSHSRGNVHTGTCRQSSGSHRALRTLGFVSCDHGK
jgi:hypothetical protein